MARKKDERGRRLLRVTEIAQGTRVPLRGAVFFTNKLRVESSQRSIPESAQKGPSRTFLFRIRNKLRSLYIL